MSVLTEITPLSNEHRILRFLGKGSSLTEDQIKGVFATREVMTNPEFETALINLRDTSLVEPESFVSTATGITLANTIETTLETRREDNNLNIPNHEPTQIEIDALMASITI